MLIIAALIAANCARAQDYITKTNGDDIKAKVLEVTPTEVKYKRFESLEGATYVINKSDVLIIHYHDGTRDVITTSVPANSIQAAVPAPENTAKYTPPPPVQVSATEIIKQPVAVNVSNTLTLENNTRQGIMAAYVIYDSTEKSWVSYGWYNIAAYSNYVADLGNYTGFVYIHAQRGRVGEEWGAGKKFCVEDIGKTFKILDADMARCRKKIKFDVVKLEGKNTIKRFNAIKRFE